MENQNKHEFKGMQNDSEHPFKACQAIKVALTNIFKGKRVLNEFMITLNDNF